MKVLLSVLFCVALISPAAQAENEKVRVGFVNALAPWVIPESNSGILVELLEQTLQAAGYGISRNYYPYARRIVEYKLGRLDVICDINQVIIDSEKLDGFYSGDVYAYQNFAFALKDRGFDFKQVSDLTGVSLMSWQGATVRLGDEYAKMAKQNLRYQEVADQALQVKMLLGRVEVVQMDLEIFKYYLAEVGALGRFDAAREVERFPLFGKSRNGFMFRKREHRTPFSLS
ncbi:transporter substrate-binding domain-containing protein [Allohahella marinimesophila]|uniref:Solute-binding protein family 3/N-terminal domain-containing protein n=1 Tax=Allohahella marinimesophila TaxID=1054972 RepID=A0ABP7P640_9GAMM